MTNGDTDAPNWATGLAAFAMPLWELPFPLTIHLVDQSPTSLWSLPLHPTRKYVVSATMIKTVILAFINDRANNLRNTSFVATKMSAVKEEVTTFCGENGRRSVDF